MSTESENVADVSRQLMKKYTYRTMSDSGGVYVYNTAIGTYTNGAEWRIKQEAQGFLGGEASVHTVNEIYECIRRVTITDRSNFDSDPNLLCVGNGVLDLTTHKLRPHSSDDMFLRRVAANYNPYAECPVALKFLSEIVEPSNARRLQQFIGYTLMPGYRYHKAFILVGGGDNGKDTFCYLLRTFLGDENCSTLTLQQMCNEKFQRPALYGRMANIAPEMGSVAIKDTEALKSLTGESSVSVENKNEKPFTFVNSAKLIFACNEIPPATGADMAYYGRWVIIPFPNTFRGKKRNEHLREQLTSEDELSGLLNFALEGVDSLKRHHGFDYPNDYENNRMLYQAWSGNTIHRFFATQLVKDPESTVAKIRFASEYRSFCVRLGKPPEADVSFFMEFNKIIADDVVDGVFTIDGERVRAIRGLRFLSDSGVVQDTIPYTISINPKDIDDDSSDLSSDI